MLTVNAKLVYVEKDGELRVHLAKVGEVHWTGGRTTQEWLPACGTRVDVTALMNYTGYTNEVSCGRCARQAAILTEEGQPPVKEITLGDIHEALKELVARGAHPEAIEWVLKSQVMVAYDVENNINN